MQIYFSLFESLSSSNLILHVYLRLQLTLMFIVVETAGNCSAADRVQLQRIMTAALPHLQQQISGPKVAASRSRKQDLRLKHALIGLRKPSRYKYDQHKGRSGQLCSNLGLVKMILRICATFIISCAKNSVGRPSRGPRPRWVNVGCLSPALN